tara:strand:+ start:93 stop:1400 length:1308 start_codon:yes stop_codon:yes gene_type:complete
MRHIIKINGWYHFKRRIPKRYKKHYEEQDVIQVSLKTTSESVAIQRASVLREELDNLWDKLSKGAAIDKDYSYHKAVHTAQTFNFSYRPISELATSDIETIMDRLDALQSEIPETEDNVAALLGGKDKPLFPISSALDSFIEFEKPNHTRKNESQLRKWKNPKVKAVSNFIKVCGDLSVEQITRNDILAFRSWWQERVESENLSPNSPNKDFTHLRTLLFFAKDNHAVNINVDELFTRIRFKEVKSKRLPFETNYIRDVLLNLDNLKGLERECQLFLFAMADLGARPSELVGLNFKAGDIRLDTEIPYIHIHAEKDKEIKTPYSERYIPLVGASLYAFQNLPNGFERYYRKPDQLSGNLNKFLRHNGLLPSDDHSLYSLRHSFEDRLTAIEPPDKVQAALMGHRYDRPRYGDGPSLEQKYKWLQKIALRIDLPNI